MAKKAKAKKVKTNAIKSVDTSRAYEPKSYQIGKELRVDKELDKKKDVKEKDVFDFSYKK
jgi:hypothetical protein